jgi:putative MFS transporter
MSDTAYKYGKFLDTLPMNRRHWTLFLVCAVTFAFDALDFQIMALVAPAMAKEWGLRPQELGFVLSSTAIGMLIGAYLFGALGDRIGRRSGFQITVAIFAIFSGLCAFAENPTQLAILRFITGIGIGGFVPIDTAMMTEYTPAKKRGRMMAWFAMFFPLGGLLAALAAKQVVPDLGWRALFIVGVIPAIMVLLVRLLIPESPRYLLSRGRLEEARESIAWIANGKPVPETSGIQPLSPPSASFSFLELFDRRYLARTLMLTALWFCWAFSYFGLLIWLPSLLTQHKGLPAVEVFTFIMGFMLSGIAGRIVMSFLVDSWGRRYTIAFCAVAAAATAMLFSQQTTHSGLVLFGYAFAFFHDGGYSGIAPYAPELYPTRARSTDVGWANGAGRIAGILSPIAIGYLVPVGLWAVFAALASGYLLAGLVVLAFGIETKGMILEDAALETVSEEPSFRGAPSNDRAHA